MAPPTFPPLKTLSLTPGREPPPSADWGLRLTTAVPLRAWEVARLLPVSGLTRESALLFVSWTGGASCPGWSRTVPPASPTSSSTNRTGCRALSVGPPVTSLLTLGVCLLLSTRLPWLCFSAQTGAGFLGKARPFRKLGFLARCLWLEFKVCQMLESGSMGPSPGVEAGCSGGR